MPLQSWFFIPAQDRILSAGRHVQRLSNGEYRAAPSAQMGLSSLSAASYNRKFYTAGAWPILTYIAAAP
jgi:hypothetical protein